MHDAVRLSTKLGLWPQAKARKPHATRTLSLVCHRRRLFPSVGRPLALTASGAGMEFIAQYIPSLEQDFPKYLLN